MRALAGTLLLFGVAACNRSPETPAAPDADAVAPITAGVEQPSPIDVAALRRGLVTGLITHHKQLLTTANPQINRREILEVDATGFKQHVSVLYEDGTINQRGSVVARTWAETLSDSRDGTWTEGRIQVPAGTFDCWIQVENVKSAAATVVRNTWYAKSRPGLIVLSKGYVNGKTSLILALTKLVEPK